MNISGWEMAVRGQALLGSRDKLVMDIPDRGIFSQMLDIPATKKLPGELIHVF
jgi:hypothetical protein